MLYFYKENMHLQKSVDDLCRYDLASEFRAFYVIEQLFTHRMQRFMLKNMFSSKKNRKQSSYNESIRAHPDIHIMIIRTTNGHKSTRMAHRKLVLPSHLRAHPTTFPF